MHSGDLVNYIEALIFASESGISLPDIRQVIENCTAAVISPEEIQAAVEQIKTKYLQAGMAIELVEINQGYQFLTRKEFFPVINQLHIHRNKKKLSQAALETLAIVAYKQPVTKLEIEQIRGVNCDYTVQKLLDKELIRISGKAESLGKPLLYSLSSVFMDYFGINSPADLPLLKDLLVEANEIGDPRP